MEIDIMQLWNCFKHRKNRLFICFVLTALFACGSVSAQMRVWEDASGVSVQAEFVRELFGSVELRRPSGKLHSIPLENLSDQDARYLRTRIPPEIELTVRTKKMAKARNQEFMKAGDEINVVTATVQIKKNSRAPYFGVMRGEIYLIGKEVATDDYRLSGKGFSQVQFTEENPGTCSFESSADFRVYDEYNRLQQRGAEYVGYLVVILDALGNRLAVETDISWLEGDKIDALRKFHVDSFFDKECRKRSVPRPQYYSTRFDFP